MKTTLFTLLSAAAIMTSANAAVAITGTLGTAFKGSDGVTNIPNGSLAFLIVDSDGDGFLTLSGSSVTAGLTGKAGTSTLAVANANTTVGSLFGGDKVISIATTGNSASVSSLLPSTTIGANELGKNFAFVWFTKSAATINGQVDGIAGESFGIIRGADWTLPATDSGTFTLSSTDANTSTSFYSFSATLSAGQIGAGGFFSGSGTAGDATADVRAATFSVAPVPEPSAALLGMLGALGLLRRRR